MRNTIHYTLFLYARPGLLYECFCGWFKFMNVCVKLQLFEISLDHAENQLYTVVLWRVWR